MKSGNLQRKTIIVMLIALALYVGFALYADLSDLSSNLGRFAWWTLGAALLLTNFNYLLRGVRWQLYLNQLGIDVVGRRSAAIFLSGFAFSVTPGKVGEIFKSVLLKRAENVPMTRSAPIVVAERLTDFIALCLLILVGVFTFNFHTWALVATCILVVVGTIVLATPALLRPVLKILGRLPVIGKVSDKLSEMAESMAELLRPRLLLSSVLLSVVAWAAECLGFYLVLYGLGGTELSLQVAVFIYASTSILGAISMLPGGLGVQETSMVSAILYFGLLSERAPAVAATLLIRLVTLWYAVGVGFVAMAVFEKMTGLDAQEEISHA